MGRKERTRKKSQSKIIKEQQKKLSDRQFLEQEVFKLRSETSTMRTKFMETLVRITKEISILRSNQTIFDRILTNKGTITQADAVAARFDIKAEVDKMFDGNGVMRGDPSITCYNCDFTIDNAAVKVKKVDTMGKQGQ